MFLTDHQGNYLNYKMRHISILVMSFWEKEAQICSQQNSSEKRSSFNQIRNFQQYQAFYNQILLVNRKLATICDQYLCVTLLGFLEHFFQLTIVDQNRINSCSQYNCLLTFCPELYTTNTKVFGTCQRVSDKPALIFISYQQSVCGLNVVLARFRRQKKRNSRSIHCRQN